MLTHLTINNFAIVRQLDLALNDGMTVITGETGAGKSIGIDALGLCLGYRSESSMVRDKNNKTSVSATFSIQPNSPAFLWLKKYELLDDDNPQECILRRILNSEGRSKAFVNNHPLPVSQLRELGQYLIHLNGQHAPQLLLKSDYQLNILDNYTNLTALLGKMATQYAKWKKLNKDLKSYKQRCLENESRKQLLQYQVEELDEFSLKQGEFEELEENYNRLANADQLISLSQHSLDLLTENTECNIDSMLYSVISHLGELAEVDANYSPIQEMLNEALIQIQEASADIQSIANNIEQDPELLYELETRISKAMNLARKHNITAKELWQYHRQLQQELQDLVNFEDSEEQLIYEEKLAYQQCLILSEEIYQKRLEASQKLSEQVTKQIKQLAMENGEFSIDVQHNPEKFSVNGADSVIFNLRSNLGQEPQPLAKIASGGELSRISLVIQVLTANKLSTPTIIFDEVDVGISGSTATAVGKLLRKLAKRCQVLCVTHLPQVASYGHHHFNVEKFVQDAQTETRMSYLSTEERVTALAKLLGGNKISKVVLANAQEMLDLSQKE
ncbi:MULTISPECIES: DNA repair protein RecN [Pasteurellaceae]|uniref:DNA repair protein RecN n=1 Tax=Pasteurella atlantica TaxID=2827233 RepID=A0AAW8CQS0_9PAST|nr:DNA repair protein RecN [Pasteurella atlantica]MBR0573781.1 DNA repair protein RecN [Pasteurella atlantica]MDP8039717.1 DNA repair protein RecN [Pasteurella atlantica]MDP8041902.1 DNA repair protein RecN [Pasteurella atlantica]MDP8044073.1 DNA repair protein RecN [Pasteurella atlantica]MDP8046051.1 DNA repair protein RecN [Pasteurella atlantica]